MYCLKRWAGNDPPSRCAWELARPVALSTGSAQVIWREAVRQLEKHSCTCDPLELPTGVFPRDGRSSSTNVSPIAGACRHLKADDQAMPLPRCPSRSPRIRPRRSFPPVAMPWVIDVRAKEGSTYTFHVFGGYILERESTGK